MSAGAGQRPLPRWRRVSLPLLLGTVAVGASLPGPEGDALPGLLLPAIPVALLLVGTMDLLLRGLDRSKWGGARPRPRESLPVRYWIGLAAALAVTGFFFILFPFFVRVLLPDYSWPLDRPIRMNDLARIKILIARDPHLIRSPVAPMKGPGWSTHDWEPVHLAAWSGNIGAAALILAAGASPNSLGTGGGAPPPLSVAVREGQVEMAVWLIRHGADVNACDWGGQRPLHVAARAGDLRLCELLLSYGAHINVQEDYAGKTPLDYATRGIGRTLRRLGALGEGSFCPSLHLVARSGRGECVREMLACGADPNLRNGAGKTPLHLAAELAGTIRDASQTVLALLEQGADPNARDRSGSTPLHVAVDAGNLTTVDLLLTQGADPLLANSRGEAPLDRALLRRNPAIGERLLEAGGLAERPE